MMRGKNISAIEIEAQICHKRRPHQRADEHDVAAAGRVRQPREFADLAEHEASDAESAAINRRVGVRRASGNSRPLVRAP